MIGTIDEVIRAYEGQDAANHVAAILAQASSHD
jgi:hypothetical protein